MGTRRRVYAETSDNRPLSAANETTLRLQAHGAQNPQQLRTTHGLLAQTPPPFYKPPPAPHDHTHVGAAELGELASNRNHLATEGNAAHAWAVRLHNSRRGAHARHEKPAPGSFHSRILLRRLSEIDSHRCHRVAQCPNQGARMWKLAVRRPQDCRKWCFRPEAVRGGEAMIRTRGAMLDAVARKTLGGLAQHTSGCRINGTLCCSNAEGRLKGGVVCTSARSTRAT